MLRFLSLRIFGSADCSWIPRDLGFVFHVQRVDLERLLGSGGLCLAGVNPAMALISFGNQFL